jgi:arabinofuranosyltransferase
MSDMGTFLTDDSRASPPLASPEPALLQRLEWGLLGVFVVMLVRTAWICDDAYISLRVVDNFVGGYGLRWNVDERVQVFTHPLWLFVISGFYALTREAYFTVLSLSIAVSFVAIWIYVRRIAADIRTAMVGLLTLTLSKSFIDYSTSGLENPLTHLLLACFFAIYFLDNMENRRRLLALSLTTGLLALDRLDALLLVAPALAERSVRFGVRASVRSLALGFLPLIAWEMFSLIYYGLPFPNTAYAKLGGEILGFERATQGMYYLLDGVSMDPLTSVLIALGIVVPIALRDRASWPLVCGSCLSIVYVVSIGGDFMSGRMLSGTFFLAVITLTHRDWSGETRLVVVPIALAIMLGLGATDPDLLTGRRFRHDGTDRDGIVDERRVYFPWTGFVNAIGNGGPLTHPWANEASHVLERGDRVAVWGANGFYGFVAGRRLHIIDKFALGDALLARLPAEAGWYAGHLPRRIPAGYYESVAARQNLIAEPGIAALYERIRVATQAPLFSRGRLHVIWRLNIDGFRDLLEGTSYDIREIAASEAGAIADAGTSVPGAPIRLRERGVRVRFDRPLRGTPLEITVDGNDEFFVLYSLGTSAVGHTVVHRAWAGEPSSPHSWLVQPPASAIFDRVEIRPRRVWGSMSLWSIRARS